MEQQINKYQIIFMPDGQDPANAIYVNAETEEEAADIMKKILLGGILPSSDITNWTIRILNKQNARNQIPFK